MDINEYMNTVRRATETCFPGATHVEVLISTQKVKVTPHYAGEFAEECVPYQTISGGCCSGRETE